MFQDLEWKDEVKKQNGVALFSSVLCGFLQVVEGPILKQSPFMDNNPPRPPQKKNFRGSWQLALSAIKGSRKKKACASSQV